MGGMVVYVQLELCQILTGDTNVAVGDVQDVVAIRRWPGADGCDCMARQPVEWQWVYDRQQVGTGNVEVRHGQS